MPEVLLAALQTGLYVTPINTGLATPEIAHILADSGAGLVSPLGDLDVDSPYVDCP